jgi:hypothetical protein
MPFIIMLKLFHDIPLHTLLCCIRNSWPFRLLKFYQWQAFSCQKQHRAWKHSSLQLGQRDVNFLWWLKQSASQMLVNYLNYTNIQKGTQNDVIHSSWAHMDSLTSQIPMRYLIISIMYLTCHHVQTTFKSILKDKKWYFVWMVIVITKKEYL